MPFLDSTRFDASTLKAHLLRAALIDAFRTEEEIRGIAQDAGIELTEVRQGLTPSDLWRDILERSADAHRLRDLITRAASAPGKEGHSKTISAFLEPDGQIVSEFLDSLMINPRLRVAREVKSRSKTIAKEVGRTSTPRWSSWPTIIVAGVAVLVIAGALIASMSQDAPPPAPSRKPVDPAPAPVRFKRQLFAARLEYSPDLAKHFMNSIDHGEDGDDGAPGDILTSFLRNEDFKDLVDGPAVKDRAIKVPPLEDGSQLIPVLAAGPTAVPPLARMIRDSRTYFASKKNLEFIAKYISHARANVLADFKGRHGTESLAYETAIGTRNAPMPEVLREVSAERIRSKLWPHEKEEEEEEIAGNLELQLHISDIIKYIRLHRFENSAASGDALLLFHYDDDGRLLQCRGTLILDDLSGAVTPDGDAWAQRLWFYVASTNYEPSRGKLLLECTSIQNGIHFRYSARLDETKSGFSGSITRAEPAGQPVPLGHLTLERPTDLPEKHPKRPGTASDSTR